MNDKFTSETVLSLTHHTEKLITFSISRPKSYRFSAGQFSRLGLDNGQSGIWRAYSICSPEYADTLDYIAVLITNGAMSQYLKNLKIGDTVWLDKIATGFLLPERFVDGRDLMMLSTGSGIAPFVAQLKQPQLWEKFETVTLVHCVRHDNELIFNDIYQQLMNNPLVSHYARNGFSYVPITTGERLPVDVLHQRLPVVLQNGTLQMRCQPFSIEQTRWMICGNPQMVQETYTALKNMGFTMHRNKIAGQILMENGF